MKIILRSLMGLIALVLFANVVNAQYVANDPTPLGDGDNPYVGTKYTYEVTPDGGTVEWLVFDDNGMLNPTDGAKFTFDGGVNNTASVAITWNTEGTYYLTYKETLNGCSTYRGVVVIATANDFYLTLAADSEACNSEQNNVLDWTTYETKDDVKTKLTYQVAMNKNAGFDIDTWEFTGTFSFSPGSGLSIDAATDVVVIDGTKTAGGSNGTFSVSANEANTLVTIEVSVSGKVTDGGDVILTLSNGAAVIGSLNVADNVLLPTAGVQPDATLRDRVQTQDLKPLPGATNISF